MLHTVIRGLIYNRCVRTKPALKEGYATAKGGIYKNKLDGKMRAPARKLWPMRTNSFSRSEKINEVNNDFKLCFHVDLH